MCSLIEYRGPHHQTGPIPIHIVIVGGGRVGRTLATRSKNRGETVTIVERDREAVETARATGVTVYHADGTDTQTLESVGVDSVDTVVAATGDDDTNLLVAQLVISKFDTESVIARVNGAGNVDAFEELGIQALSSTESVARAIHDVIERPAITEWMTELVDGGEVREIEVAADDVVGMTISELDADLPEGVIVLLVTRDGSGQVPDPNFEIERGDHVTFLGRAGAVRTAIQRTYPNAVDVPNQ